MNPIRNTETLVAGLLRTAIFRPRAVLCLWGLLLAIGGFGVFRLEVETSTDSILSRADTAWQFYRRSVDKFGGDEIVVVALRSNDPFDPATLDRVRRLSERIEQVPGVRRVDSLSTVPNVRARPDGTLELDPALTPDTQLSQPGSIAEFANQVREDRLAPRSLVSDDGRTFAVNVLMEDLGADYDSKVVNGVREALTASDAWVTGGPVFRIETNQQTQAQVLLFIPLTIVIIASLLYFAFRSVRAALIPLAISGAGSWLAVAALGVSGTPLTISTMILPSILLALGCAYVMHALVAAAGVVDRESLSVQLEKVARPITLSGLTTAIGFESMTLVRIESIQYLGTFGAIGVLILLAATLSAGPAMLSLWPISDRRPLLSAQIRGGLASALVRLCLERKRLVVGGWLVLAAGFGVGVARLEVETDVTRWFPEGTDIRDSYEEVRGRLSGISPMNVVIESKNGGDVSSTAVINAIDGLDAFLSNQKELGKVISIADPLRQLHGGFVEDPSMPLPQGDDLIAQYLLLLEGMEQIRDVLADDRQAANVLMRADDNGSIDLLDVAERAERWWQRNGVEGFEARVTGIMYEYARAEDEIAYGQIRGLAVAFGVISVILLAIFRSVAVAGAALVPNLVPIVIVFGTMGLLGIPLDAGTVSVGCLALGIAVDDTIHVVMGYQSRRIRGRGVEDALRAALQAVLVALIYTTAVVSAGFIVLGISDFTIIRSLGLLTAGLMSLCLLADVTLLPSLLTTRRHPEG